MAACTMPVPLISRDGSRAGAKPPCPGWAQEGREDELAVSTYWTAAGGNMRTL